ncbi:FtsK/SpoIIIE domain-containing protein [Glaciibacter sp. 2TAF33]|uniref:FtsK/SpoIIIE domain-containing protein n=1 Tax=Glaciibacter sp. 2TAF33 TaxID=3233015 RepID=UPI003F9198D2
MTLPTRPLQMPAPPTEPQRAPFPLIASVAPLLASVVIWAITGSAFMLLFAALGPVIIVATLLDGHRAGRRRRRADAVAYRSSLDAVRLAMDQRHAELRTTAWHRTPSAAAILSGNADDSRWRSGAPVTALGSGAVPSGMRLEAAAVTPATGMDAELAQRAADLGASAATLRAAPVTADLTAGVGLVGADQLVLAAARGLLIQAAHALPPDRALVTAPPDWRWAAALPHRHARAPTWEVVLAGARRTDRLVAAPTRLLIALAARPEDLPDGCATVLFLHGPRRAEILLSPDHEPGLVVRPELVSECEAMAWATALAERALHAGFTGAPSLPDSVTLADLHPLPKPNGGEPPPDQPGPPAATGSLACPIGLSDSGPVWIDLVRDGPHALVGGTTGSGKSELLVTWIASIAARYRPNQVNVLLVDFKGGAAFVPLLPLPHCVGLITDLDQREAARALASLQAELRYREQVLRDAGARDVADEAAAGTLPRLVIAVDEFQAMLDSFPELHAAFVDIAARGRSLGMHLILCTQRPAGVVRDALLANCSLRLSLRVNNRADSMAVIGTDAAAALPASAPGRCLVGSGDRVPTPCQVAVTTAADVTSIGAGTPATPLRRPWRDPLPARVSTDELLAMESRGEAAPAAGGLTGRHARGPRGLLLGLIDQPTRQRYRVARYDPESDGSLLVIGGARSGKSTLLARLGAEGGAVVVPPAVDVAWDALVDAGEGREASRGGLLLLDDFDSVFARWEGEYQAGAVDLLSGVLRDGRVVGMQCVIAMQRIVPALRGLQSMCPSTLVLGLQSREEHLAAGGLDAMWDPRLPPGGGSWKGERIQLVTDAPESGTGTAAATGTASGTESHAGPAAPGGEPAPVLRLDRPLAVVSGRPARTAAHLRSAAAGAGPGRAADIVELTSSASGIEVTDAAAGTILVGEPDAWQLNWPLLASVRTRMELVFDQCSLADYRLVTRRRDLPPAVVPGRGQVWVLDPQGAVRRARLPAKTQ